jgi:hypothetical protein
LNSTTQPVASAMMTQSSAASMKALSAFAPTVLPG